MVGTSAAFTGFANAQTPAVPMVTVIPPAQQQPVTANGGNAANSNNNYQAAMLPGAVANPTPGTFVVRLNGLVVTEFGVGGGSGFVGNGPSPGDVRRARPGARQTRYAQFPWHRHQCRAEAGAILDGHLFPAVSRRRRHGDQRPALRRPGGTPRELRQRRQRHRHHRHLGSDQRPDACLSGAPSSTWPATTGA